MNGACRFDRSAVLGAGTMGAQIAAHFANAGVPALLLDLTADVARDGLKRARALKPDPFFTPDTRRADHDRRLRHAISRRWPTSTGSSKRSSSGSTSSARCSSASTASAARARSSSSNTSGIPIAALAEGRSDDFRRHWLGTHFFNPPRYLQLLELIPTADTDPAVVERVACVRRSSPRQRRRRREGHAELHRQPHRRCTASCRCCGRSSPAATRSRRSTRSPGRRSAGRRARRSARWTSPASTCSRTSRSNLGDRAAVRSSPRMVERGMGRREGRPGLLQEDAHVRLAVEILTLDPRDADVPAEAAARLPSLEAARSDRRRRRSGSDAVRGAGQGRRVPARDAGADARLHGAASRRRSPTRSTTSIARCGGASAGSSGRSRR